MRRFKSLIPAACIAALNLASPQALAQAYPSKPVRIVVPYASGGGSDILARQIGASRQKAWGQGVVVDNKAGAGRLRVVGVTTAHRYGLLPDTPTFEEQGLKPFDFSIWYALMGPANLPAPVVARLVANVEKILADPAVQASLSNAGVEPYQGTAKELAGLIKSDSARYLQLAKSANIKAE